MMKCLISTIVISLVAFMVLALLFSIAEATNVPDKSWIFAVVWGCLYALGLGAYWFNQIYKFKRQNKK